MPTYKVDYSGQTEGAKSKKTIRFKKDTPVECAKDDLKHLGDHVEMISQAKTAVVNKAEKRQEPKEEPKYPIDRGAGWWELSNGEKIRGNEEEAIKAEQEIE